MADILAGLAGGFQGAGSGLRLLIQLAEQKRQEEESTRRFNEQMGLNREEFGYRREQDTAERAERGRDRVTAERQRVIDNMLRQINQRGGSYFGAPDDLVSEAQLPQQFPRNVGGAIGQFAPGAGPGVEAALEAARGARANRSAEMAGAITKARQQAQSTQRSQQAGDFPITVDPQEIFDPNRGQAQYANIAFRENQERMKRLDGVYRNVINAMKGGASGKLLADIFTNPERKAEIEAQLTQMAKALYVSQLQGHAQIDPVFALISQDPGWVEGVIPSIVQDAINEAGRERMPASPPDGGSAGFGLEVPPPPGASAAPAGPSKDAQRLLDIQRRMGAGIRR